MDQLWTNYLEQVYPMYQIEEIIVYTDSHRYWFADGLLAYAESHDIKASVTLLDDELTEEAILEIRQSMGLFDETTLLAGIFSIYNPTIEEINLLFNPFSSPAGFSGYSFLSQYNFPNQYLVNALDHNYDRTFENKEKIVEILRGDNLSIISDGETFLEFNTIGHTAIYPHDLSEGNHILFPSTEVVKSVEPQSVNGVIEINRSIGEYWDKDELIDPMGKVEKSIKLLIEEGKIIDISGSSSFARRFKRHLRDFEEENRYISQISIGTGRFQEKTGFIEVDRLSENTITFGIENNKLEWNVGPITFEHI